VSAKPTQRFLLVIIDKVWESLDFGGATMIHEN
jgi:hypothetical protein